jgi:hypothetical protein
MAPTAFLLPCPLTPGGGRRAVSHSCTSWSCWEGSVPLCITPLCKWKDGAMVHWRDVPHRERAVTSPCKTDGPKPCCPKLPPGNPGTAAWLPTPDTKHEGGGCSSCPQRG